MTEHRPRYAGTEVPVCAVCQDWWPCPHAVVVTEPKPTPAAAIEAVLRVMDWPDDREQSAHIEPDGYQLTPPGAYWDTAEEIAAAVIAATTGGTDAR